jgi:hypothetical protein
VLTQDYLQHLRYKKQLNEWQVAVFTIISHSTYSSAVCSHFACIEEERELRISNLTNKHPMKKYKVKVPPMQANFC